MHFIRKFNTWIDWARKTLFWSKNVLGLPHQIQSYIFLAPFRVMLLKVHTQHLFEELPNITVAFSPPFLCNTLSSMACTLFLTFFFCSVWTFMVWPLHYALLTHFSSKISLSGRKWCIPSYLCEFKACLVYRASSRTSRVTERNPVSKRTNKKTNQCNVLLKNI